MTPTVDALIVEAQAHLARLGRHHCDQFGCRDVLSVAEEVARLQASEALALRRLSLALTGGNAGTWEEVFHAAEGLRL